MRIYSTLLIITTFNPFVVFGQIAFHSDIYLAEEGTLGIHTQETSFISGGILTDDARPGITFFAEGTNWDGANHRAHAEGYVWITAHSDFNFPTGHSGIFQPMAIHNSPNSSIAGRFVHDSPIAAPLGNGIGKITPEYYWEAVGEDTAQLSFGWTALSNLTLIADELEDLLIVGFNGDQWEIIPAKINLNLFGDQSASTLTNGAITTLDKVDLNRFNRFTFGNSTMDNDIQVSEAFTPNGDNINDRWYIRNINLYPNANIRVYNRWGNLIYEAKEGYENDWNGHYAKKRNPLPSAPYFYQIDLESDGEIDVEGWLYINY